MRYAVYDIGSNSVKFLVAEQTDGPLRILAEESHATRLAENLIASAELKPEAMERTLRVLGGLHAQAVALGVVGAGTARAVATSAVRDSANRKQFLKALASPAVLGPETEIRLLSGEEEAEGVYRGICSDAAFRGRDLLGIDVGGGSTEWIVGSAGRIGRRISLPLGCVRLRERFVPAYPVPPEARARLAASLDGQLEPALAPFRLPGREVVGTGGTATAAAALDLGLATFDAAALHGHVLTLERIGKVADRLAALSLSGLAALPGIPPKRADLLVPGLAVFAASLRLLGADRLTVSVRGLRYGVLAQLVEEKGG